MSRVRSPSASRAALHRKRERHRVCALHLTSYILHPISHISPSCVRLRWHQLEFGLSHSSEFVCILHPTSHIPYLTSRILHRTSYILHRTSYTVHPHRTSQLTSYILHPTSYILYPTPYILYRTSQRVCVPDGGDAKGHSREEARADKWLEISE